MKSYQTIKSAALFKGRIAEVICDTITLPNGKTTEREVVLRGNASAVLPVDKDGNIILVRQYRHPIGKEILEIPAGMLEDGEDPMACAIREMEEETALKPNKITHMFKIYPSVGFCTEIIYLYLAEDLETGQLNLDEDEFVATEKYTLDECLNMIFNNEINDSKTIAAILAYKEMMNR